MSRDVTTCWSLDQTGQSFWVVSRPREWDDCGIIETVGKYLVGNITLNLEISLWTWKHHFELGNITINLETSFLVRMELDSLLQNGPVFYRMSPFLDLNYYLLNLC